MEQSGPLLTREQNGGPDPVPRRDPWPGALGRLLAATPPALAVFGAVALAAYTAVAVVHLNSSYRINHVAGSWMAQAAHWAAGSPYPPIGGSEVFGGTRFMPGFIAAHAALSRVTGETLISGKLLTFASFLLLLAAVFLVLRRSSCPTGVAIALAAAVAMTETGLRAGMTVRGDALPAALALAAMAVTVHDRRRSAAAVGGVLAGLALLSKQSALWAPAALLIWLAFRHRRQVWAFVLGFSVVVAVGLAAAQLASDGRFLEQVVDLSFAGSGSATLPQAAVQGLALFMGYLPAMWGLVPFALLAVLLAVVERRLDPYQLALVAAAAVAIVTLRDFGTGDNQLLDLAALSAVVIGRLWVRLENARERVLQLAMALAVVWVSASPLVLQVRPSLEEAAAIVTGRVERPTFDATVAALPPGSVLSEQPAVPLARGELPAIVDAWMIARIAETDPDAVRPLLDRMRDQEFAALVLLGRFDDPDAETEGWYRNQHFGDAVIEEMRRAYRYSTTTADDLYVYVPRGAE